MSTRQMTEELRYDPPTPAMQATAAVMLAVNAVVVLAFAVHCVQERRRRRKKSAPRTVEPYLGDCISFDLDTRIEKTHCTLCAAVPSPMFYTGCMFMDGHDCNGWTCDGKGNLTRSHARR